jgi:hypothetical protein
MSPAVTLGRVAVCLGEPLVIVWLPIIDSRTRSTVLSCRQSGHHDDHSTLPQLGTNHLGKSVHARLGLPRAPLHWGYRSDHCPI